MTRWQPDVALERLVDALEAEIIGSPEPEVAAVLSEGRDKSNLHGLRGLVACAVEHAEEGVIVPPKIHGALPALRR
jgi:hypothetical protein